MTKNSRNRINKTKQHPLVTLLLFIFLLIVFAGISISLLSSPANHKITESEKFVIPKGQAVSIIGKRLQEEGLIRNHWIFRFTVKKEELEKKLQAGSFELAPSMTVKEIAKALTQGTEDLWITIPEGWRREEIGESLVKQELEDFDQKKFLKQTVNLEGMLFPDTYLVPREILTEQVVNLLIQTFDRKVTKALGAEIAAFEKRTDYDFEDALIMASIVERESRGYEQMRQVARVLWNRMEIGMALQVDASLQYIKGYNRAEDSWWSPPTAADKKLSSAYNTYKYPGLPPQSIANPGLEAIKAVLNPTSNDYLYYLHDRQGEIHFAKTLDQHNLNIENYLQ